MKYGYPRGRRVDARAADEPFAPAPRLGAVPFERAGTPDDLPACPRGRPPSADVPRVGVPDDAGIHARKVVKAARPGRAEVGVSSDHLPPYSPERNRTGLYGGR